MVLVECKIGCGQEGLAIILLFITDPTSYSKTFSSDMAMYSKI